MRKCDDAADWPFSACIQQKLDKQVHWKTDGTEKVLANRSLLHTIPEVVPELFLPEPLPNALDIATNERGHNVNGVDGV